MMRFFTSFIFVLLLSTNTYSSEYLKNSDADARVHGAEELWFKSGSEVPQYIRFQKGFTLEEKDAIEWLRKEFKLQPGLNYILEKSLTTEDQVSHSFYRVELNDVPYEFVRLVIHSRDGFVRAISGHILANGRVSNAPVIDKKDAIVLAKTAVGSALYKWEIAGEEKWLQEYTGNPKASFYPKPELVIVSANGNYNKQNFRFAYKMNVYSQDPVASENVYVDAESGQILFRQNMIAESDTTGLAHTGFSGIKQIMTNFNGQDFDLSEVGRGKGIHTWNMKNGTDISAAVDFKDEDNNWIYSQSDLDVYATDAHWGSEMTHDYLKSAFGRNGINDSGFVLNNYVHFGEAYNNAQWDATLKIMMYGDGPSNLIPLTTLDIVGHEIGHGLTQFTANLIYQNESGALNESFSDILGNCVEYYGKPGTMSWRIGEDMGDFLRDMSFPKSKGQPDTYKGEFWYDGINDNGGVHTNSGVQNFWFYLVSAGGNGKNDLNQSYDVTGIGIMNAALVAYRTLTVYLTPTSDYEEMSFFSTKAAVDIFGNCSFQHETVVKAWNAVGLQNGYIDHTVADFKADEVAYCNLPINMTFRNESINGENFLWDFGDGTTSNEINPAHVYNQAGQYSVKLSVDGKGCGTDEIIKSNLVHTFETESPNVSPASIYKGDSIELGATSARGVIQWYADQAGTILLAQGNHYQTPSLDKNTTYYVQTLIEGQSKIIGEKLSENLTTGQFSNLNVGLVFNTYQDVIIQSVRVSAETAGDRIFRIKDNNGNLLFEETKSLVAGVQEVSLNASVPAGEGFILSYGGILKNLWMSDKVDYPYEFSGLVSITGNSLDMNDVYAYFYDWKVKENDCVSEMKEVVVTVEDIATVKKTPYKFYVSNSQDFSYYIDFFFRENTDVKFGLYGINGQLIYDFSKEYQKGSSTENVNQLFGLNNYPSGVYFITINGGSLERTEKIINKGGSN